MYRRGWFTYCISLFKSILTILSVWNVTKWRGQILQHFQICWIDWPLKLIRIFWKLIWQFSDQYWILNQSCTQILMLNSSTYKQSRIFLENRFNSGHYRWLIDDFDLFLWNLFFSRQTSFFVKQSLKCWFRSILYFVSLTRKLFWLQIFGHSLILQEVCGLKVQQGILLFV